ncbi:VOC family protein [Pseudonocardia acaciae]|uniref:VOC family protein n=1 Tax=Pseudonocardia acaciae TaxID=551276 RepID=UPI0006857012|nr:VOC family protein [Pseudonocardia acaciae]
MTSNRVPTLRSVDHVAFTVPDLDDAVRFFTEHLGGRLVFTDGPFTGPAAMRTRLDVHPDASCRLAMIRLGRTMNLELFEYTSPDQRTTPPANSDIGGHHLAFYVDDIDAAYAYFREVPSVTLMAGPNGVDPDAPVAGQRWFYLRTSWGLHLEMTSYSGDGFYDGLPAAGVAPPAESWD